jgi:hypothetical protein
MPKLTLGKSLRDEGNLAGIADKGSVGRLITYCPSTGFFRVGLASVPAIGALASLKVPGPRRGAA